MKTSRVSIWFRVLSSFPCMHVIKGNCTRGEYPADALGRGRGGTPLARSRPSARCSSNKIHDRKPTGQRGALARSGIFRTGARPIRRGRLSSPLHELCCRLRWMQFRVRALRPSPCTRLFLNSSLLAVDCFGLKRVYRCPVADRNTEAVGAAATEKMIPEGSAQPRWTPRRSSAPKPPRPGTGSSAQWVCTMVGSQRLSLPSASKTTRSSTVQRHRVSSPPPTDGPPSGTFRSSRTGPGAAEGTT